ncbi:hypothetical protein NQ317_011583 [Molorchus minor]|uniref:Uncharacterized protein n=1 Tax=Molorchus minor TaxID=1323400 RepID=A0ABQ9IPV8_9CUCU|nr:hypothetical protein NQ317_011583 [Molorchus minor]
MSETLEKLVRKRAVAKGNLTRFKNFLEGLDQENPDLVELELRLTKLDLCWNTFSEIQLEIEMIDEDNEQANEQALNKESHLALRSLLDKLNNHLRALKVLEQPIDQWDILIIHMVTNKLDPHYA